MKVFAENRKARNSYEFLEFFEAGVVLTGPETKSARNGGISIIAVSYTHLTLPTNLCV